MTTTNDRHDEPEKSVNEVADELASGIVETVGAVLGVGVSLARLAAKATAPAGHAVQVTPGQGPISEILQYGVAATANVLRIVPATIGEAARGVASPVRPRGGAAKAPAPAPGIPTVRDGASLRVPLSIENPTDRPMEDMRFAVARMDYQGAGAGLALPPSAIRIEPELLTVGPRDFEKLTVYVDVESGTATGRYVATIGLPNGAFEATLPFDVVPAASGEPPP